MTKEGTKLIPTVKEAEEIAFRFINGHFRNAGRDHPRMSIPADPMRDDDIRLLAFIRNSRPTPPTPAGVGTETLDALEDECMDKFGALPGSSHLPHAQKDAPITLTDKDALAIIANTNKRIYAELTSLRRQAEADRATREEQMQALGLCDDDRTVVADEIRRIRDEGRGCFHEITALRAQLASADKDRERLEWLMNYITNNGLDGLGKLAWTLYDEDGKSLMGREKVTEDEVDECRFDRATIDDGMALQPSASLDHGAREEKK